MIFFLVQDKMDKTKNMLVDTEEVTFIYLFYAAHESSRISVKMPIPVLTFELILWVSLL